MNSVRQLRDIILINYERMNIGNRQAELNLLMDTPIMFHFILFIFK